MQLTPEKPHRTPHSNNYRPEFVEVFSELCGRVQAAGFREVLKGSLFAQVNDESFYEETNYLDVSVKIKIICSQSVMPSVAVCDG